MTRAWLIIAAAVLLVLLVWLGIVVAKVNAVPGGAAACPPALLPAGIEEVAPTPSAFGVPAPSMAAQDAPAGAKLGLGRVPELGSGLYPGGLDIRKAGGCGVARHAGAQAAQGKPRVTRPTSLRSSQVTTCAEPRGPVARQPQAGFNSGQPPFPSDANAKQAGRAAIGEKPSVRPLAVNQSQARLACLFRVTAYCPCERCCNKKPSHPAYGITASGTRADHRLVAAPRKFPFGTVMTIPGYGTVRVEDRGGAIRGDRLDVFFPTHEEALVWGARWLDVDIIDPVR